MSTTLTTVQQPFNGTTFLNDSYMQAKKAAFRFDGLHKKLQELQDKRDKIIDAMGGEPQQMKVVLAYICIFIAIMLAIVEGILCKNSIAAVTGLPDIVCTLTGICFCLLGLTIGEFMAANITKDPLTGKRQYTGKFWLGLFLGFLYCGIQYFLASKSGGLHASAEIAETVNTMTIVVTAISIIEIVFGFLFMKTALQMLALGINTLRWKTVNKKKGASARRTDESWVRYIFDHQAYNNTYGTHIPCAEETELIRQARAYYSSGYAA